MTTKYRFSEDFDRERDLRRQRDTFGATLRELLEQPKAQAPAKHNKGEYKLVQKYEQLLGNWKRERSA